ncbi:MAG TPA: glycosyltransferase [Kofleriaceae bacterium]|nr:glycosyltransferase [Kofleriaceae bacterium]
MRALLVSYPFPPVAGAGVGRAIKLCKYLPEHGVIPTVLTVKNPSAPILDRSLLDEIPAGTRVIRARTLEPGYGLKRRMWESVAQEGNSHGPATPRRSPARPILRALAVGRELLAPDPQILWQPAAQLALARRLVAGADDAVVISGPPFSQFLLAPLARLRPKTAVVLDYRDEWSTYRNEYEMMGALSRVIGEPLERALLHMSHVVTTATEAFRARLLDQFSFLDPERVVCVPNGYDPDDFPSPLPVPPPDRFVITYAGTVFRLTSPRGFLDALARLHEQSPKLAKKLEVRFIGRVVDTESERLAQAERLGVVRTGYQEKGQVLRALAASHMTMCLLDDVPGAERIYPGKIFELMYLGRPCLTLAPRGALTDLVRHHRLGPIALPRDAGAICRILTAALRAFAEGGFPHRSEALRIERYHRRQLAGELAMALRIAHRVAHGGHPLGAAVRSSIPRPPSGMTRGLRGSPAALGDDPGPSRAPARATRH